MPRWLDTAVLVAAKNRVNEQYKPIMNLSDLASKKTESTKDYYARIGDVINKIMVNHKGEQLFLKNWFF